MKYEDEGIIRLRKEQRKEEYHDIRGEGVYIGDRFVRFSPRQIGSMATLFIPEDFIDMPQEVRLIKYPSQARPEEILTSLDGRVSFAFQMLEEIPKGQITVLALQMKELLHKANPSIVFNSEEMGTLSDGCTICMFDFENSGVDGRIYHMMCFAAWEGGVLHGTFNCPQEDEEEWRDAVWQAFLTIQDQESEEQGEQNGTD